MQHVAGSSPSPSWSSGAQAGAADNALPLLPEGTVRGCVSTDKTHGKRRAGRMPSIYSPNSGVPSSATAVRKSVPVPEQGDCNGAFFISALNLQLHGRTEKWLVLCTEDVLGHQPCRRSRRAETWPLLWMHQHRCNLPLSFIVP